VVVTTASASASAPPPASADRPVQPAVVEPREARTADPTAKPPAPTTPAPARAADPPRVPDPARVADPRPPKDRAPAPPPAAPPPAAPSGGGDFDRAAARSALASAAAQAGGCRTGDGPTGGARVSVTFAPSGRVTSSKVLGSTFQGTATGSCIARAFHAIAVPPFAGDPVTVTKDISVR
jgi:hypothetical protein